MGSVLRKDDSAPQTFSFAPQRGGGGLGGFIDSLSRKLRGESADDGEADSGPAAPEKQATDPLINLLSQQSADGAFDRMPPIKVYLSNAGRDAAEILKSIDQLLENLPTPPADTHKLRTTLLALAAMKQAFPTRRDIWKRAYKKALDWVASQGVDVERAERIVGGAV